MEITVHHDYLMEVTSFDGTKHQTFVRLDSGGLADLKDVLKGVQLGKHIQSFSLHRIKDLTVQHSEAMNWITKLPHNPDGCNEFDEGDIPGYLPAHLHMKKKN